jgi:hypothetical protein
LALRLKQRFAHGGFIHFDKENGILVSYSLAGNMHYTGEKTVCHYGKRRFNSQRRKYKIHDAEKFATELTKYLGIDTKT